MNQLDNMLCTAGRHVGYLVGLVCKMITSAYAKRGCLRLQKVDPPVCGTVTNPYHIPHISKAVAGCMHQHTREQ